MTQSVPFLDLLTLHGEIREELCEVFLAALGTGNFIGGPMVEEFETAFAAYCGTSYCVGLGSGTDALRCALIAVGVKPGDVVVTVPQTFIATTEAISQAGARPAFVDIDERTYNMDPRRLQDYLQGECWFDSLNRQLWDRKTERPVRAIVPVHLYGQTADMDPIVKLTEKFNLAVVEDACQAHGAEYFSRRENRWKSAGSMGGAAAFSFYPGNNLGACGEAGAVTTNDFEVATRIGMLRDHGQARKYYYEVEGYNGRLDAIQAGILSVKLRHLPNWTDRRIAAAQRYRDLLSQAGLNVVLPHEPMWARPSYHLFVIRVADREGLIAHLAKEGVESGIHYPVPLHLQNAYKSLGHRTGDFPIAERISNEVLSLPMFPDITEEQQRRVVDSVSGFEWAPIAAAS